MNLLPDEILREIKLIELRAKNLASSALAGEYASVFRGQGIEFDEIREYMVGDDIRAIDWNVTAKMHQPFVKIFREERELTIMLVIDVSLSQHFGSGKKTKTALSAELAAILAFLASNHNDKIGVILFSSTVEKYIPPRKGKGHVWHIIKSILAHKTEQKGTDLTGALQFLMRIQKKKSLCVVISDFLIESYQSQMVMVRKRHDLIACLVEDPFEEQLPPCGYIYLEDLESGRISLVNSTSKSVVETVGRNHRTRIEALEKTFRKSQIDFMSISPNKRIVSELFKLIRQREKQRLRAT